MCRLPQGDIRARRCCPMPISTLERPWGEGDVEVNGDGDLFVQPRRMSARRRRASEGCTTGHLYIAHTHAARSPNMYVRGAHVSASSPPPTAAKEMTRRKRTMPHGSHTRQLSRAHPPNTHTRAPRAYAHAQDLQAHKRYGRRALIALAQHAHGHIPPYCRLLRPTSRSECLPPQLPHPKPPPPVRQPIMRTLRCMRSNSYRLLVRRRTPEGPCACVASITP